MNCNYLYRTTDRKGVFFERCSFFKGDAYSNVQEQIVSAKLYGLKGLLSKNRLANRLLRMEPRCVERLDDDRFIICYSQSVCLLDFCNQSLSPIQTSRSGFSNPLNLCSDGQYVYWGDYGDNSTHEEVNIYRVDASLNTEVIYSFPKGAIRHIHNIIWDDANKKFYILTGDLEETSGIYESDSEWKDVRPVVVGSQQYRAVVGFPYENGLVYATDSVSEENQIYLLQDGGVKSLAPFPGSCIYGTETKDYYVFSSTVEPPEGRGFFNLFTYKLGKGIKDRYAHIITVRKSDLKVEEVYKAKKDIWPMKLFQYGTFMFPKGQNKSNDLFFNVVACKGDGETQQIHLG